MNDNAERLWFQNSLNQIAIERAAEAIEQLGRALPCSVVSVSGQIVTVQFEVSSAPFTLPQITIPVATGKYDWQPIQKGDTGITQPADVYLGGISGLGGGTADLTRRGNLSTLVFVPVSNKAWTVPNANQRVVQGPEGVLLQTLDGTNSVNIAASGVTITVGGKTWTFTSAGFTMDTGVVAETHIHSDPQGGVTGAPQSP